MSLNNLARLAPLPDALAAYARSERDLVTRPVAARQIVVDRAQLELNLPDPDTGLRTLVSVAVGLTEAREPDPAAFHARQLLRDWLRSGPSRTSQVSAIWRDVIGSEPPPWLALPDGALDLANEWINCRSWAASRVFWDEHADELRSSDTALALEDLALLGQAAEQHLGIAREAMADGPDTAFRPFITGELLDAWLALDTWAESEAYLTEHAEALLHDQALALLESDPDAPESAVHFALILLAHADGVPAAYRYAEDRPVVHERLQQLLADTDPDPDVLWALATLEFFVYQDDFTATAHLALSAAFDDTPSADYDWPPAEPADRDRVIAEIAVLIGRHPQRAAALSSLIQQILAAPTATATPPAP